MYHRLDIKLIGRTVLPFRNPGAHLVQAVFSGAFILSPKLHP